MFCACPVEFGAEPNTHTCPICLGLPGALPVMNHEALRMTVLTGLMLGCDITPQQQVRSEKLFLSGHAEELSDLAIRSALCTNGSVPLHDLAYPKDAQKNIATPDKEVRLVRIHLEEDVARSFHFENHTGIDFNRAGTPLMEIVTKPEINSPEEAFAFLTALKQILIYGAVSDADMEKGQLRCDCNVSVRRGVAAGVGRKNRNQKHELDQRCAPGARLTKLRGKSSALKRGKQLDQETRGWDDARGETFLMRTKESAHDYRYFPDPDLVPIKSESLVAEVRGRVPELPKAKRARFVAAIRGQSVRRRRFGRRSRSRALF